MRNLACSLQQSHARGRSTIAPSSPTATGSQHHQQQQQTEQSTTAQTSKPPDLIKVLASGVLLAVQGCLAASIELVNLLRACTRIKHGLGVLNACLSFYLAFHCLLMHSTPQHRLSLFMLRSILGASAAIIILNTGTFSLFYITAGWNLIDCDSGTVALLGAAAIASFCIGAPAAFIAGVLLRSNWRLNCGCCCGQRELA